MYFGGEKLVSVNLARVGVWVKWILPLIILAAGCWVSWAVWRAFSVGDCPIATCGARLHDQFVRLEHERHAFAVLPALFAAGFMTALYKVFGLANVIAERAVGHHEGISYASRAALVARFGEWVGWCIEFLLVAQVILILLGTVLICLWL